MSIIVNGTEIENVTYNGTDLDTVIYNGVTVFEKETVPEYLAFQNTGDSEILIYIPHVDNINVIEYFIGDRIPDSSFESEDWQDFDLDVEYTIPAHETIYLRGTNNTRICNEGGTVLFFDGDTTNIVCSGNICALLTWYMANPEMDEYCFFKLFEFAKDIQFGKIYLPATTLASNCYNSMFQGCTNLTTAPALPATTLASNCYQYMFDGCTSLKINNSSGTKFFTCPSTIPSGAVTNMFANTGGDYTSNPVAGGTYYYQ